MNMKKLFLMVVLLLAVVAIGCKSNSSSDASKEASTTAKVDTVALMDELIKTSGMQENLEATLNSIYAQMGYEDKELVEKMKQELPKIKKEVYLKHFTIDEIKQIVELNKDEVKQKTTKKMPQIMEECFSEGMNYAAGKQSTTVSVSDDFKKAMNEYLDADEFDKQMEQMSSVIDTKDLREMMTGVFSKYFTVDEIKHLAELSKLPISKTVRDNQAVIAKEVQEKVGKLVSDHFANKV